MYVWAGQQDVVRALRRSMSGILHVMLLFFVLLLGFAVVAVQLYSGLYSSCNDGAVGVGEIDCVGNFLSDSGVLMPRVWARPNAHFDDVLAALPALLQVLSFQSTCPLPGHHLVGEYRHPLDADQRV